jgi:hypothetical protein
LNSLLRFLSGTLIFVGLQLAAQTPSYSIDIAAQTGVNFSQPGLCSNRPFASDAKIWTVVVNLRFTTPTGLAQPVANYPYFTDPARTNSFDMVVTTAATKTIELSVAGRTYPATFVQGLDQVTLQISNRTLSELGDIVDLLSSNPDKIRDAFVSAGLKIAEYRVTYKAANSDFVPVATDAIDALLNVDPVVAHNGFAERLDRMLTSELALTTLSLSTNPDRKILLTATKVAGFAPNPASITLDSSSAAAVKQELRLLTGTSPPTSANVPPIFVIDEQCFNVSLAPSLSAAQSALTATYRVRYDWFSKSGKQYLKFRSNGDGSTTNNNFNRAEATLDAAVHKKIGGFLLTGGGNGSGSFSRRSSQNLNEWSSTAKLQVQLPTMFVSALPGASTNPVLSFEAGAVGGDNGTTTGTDFLTKATLVYTARANARLSFDINGIAAAANSHRFAGSKSFQFVTMQSRFSLTRDWDYLIKYQCGRQNPDYLKVCGWQSGVTLALGR